MERWKNILFKNGLINGKGELIWNDNSIYIGEYINNIKQSEGKFIWPNGKIFIGKFEIMKKMEIDILTKIKYDKNEIIINSNVNTNDILCYKCQNLLDNPIQCNECYIYYCNDCIVDEN